VSDSDLDLKIERLFGLIHEELRTLRELVTVKFNGSSDRLDDHDRRFDEVERRLLILERKATP
jgi:hypothetical protein